MIHVIPFKKFEKIDAFKDVIETIIEKDSNIIKKPCLEHLLGIIEEHEPTKMYGEFTEKNKNFHNYLEASNKNMKSIVDAFFEKYGNLKPRDYTKIILKNFSIIFV
jgi:hypothetical protein